MAWSLGELANLLGAELHGDPSSKVEHVATLEHATPGSLSFLANRVYRHYLATTKASAVLLARKDLAACPVAALVMDNPYLGYARAAAMLNPTPPWLGGVHECAWVSGDAHVHERAWVGPNAVVEAGATIEQDAFVGPCCVVGRDSVVGQGSQLVASVTLCHGVHIGRRALIHPGVVVGADGFGIANDAGAWVKVPQLGGVRVGDDVEIGANTTIDRGALEDTVIEVGVKLDNQIQIGHNVRIGEHTAIAGCVAIAGSVRIGARCTIGGSSAISGHIELGDDVHLTGGTQVAKSIPAAGVYSSGIPAQENRNWRKMVTRFTQLDSLFRRLGALEKRYK